MTSGLRKAINAYGKQDLKAQVEAASPHRLILMLFDGAIKSCHQAKTHMQNGSIPDKGMAISKAISIIQEGLRLSLDKDAGGALAENLDALYEYMGQRLLLANLRNDQSILDEVLNLLTGLRDSWAQIDPARADLPDAVEPEQRAAPLSYGKV